MPVWDETSRLQLLFAVMEAGEAPGKWDRVAEKMGEGYTKEAVRQQFGALKLRLETELAARANGTATTDGAPALTPKKRGRKPKGDGEAGQKASKKAKVKAEPEPEPEPEVKVEVGADTNADADTTEA